MLRGTIFQIVSSAHYALNLLSPTVLPFDSRHAFQLTGKAWFIWSFIWLALAFLSKSNKRRESLAQRLEHIVPAVIGFLFIFRYGFGVSFLQQRVFPAESPLMPLCVVITIAGLLFALWARLTLGSNWSGTITIKQNHQLIRRGPYRWIRHPIYTGMLIALLATVVTQGLVSGLIGFVFVYFALYRKAKREESFLSQEFGGNFDEHRKHTGMFLPRLS
jgi:protein-S-isoprenylcysteine O-methyltransferase Ste14